MKGPALILVDHWTGFELDSVSTQCLEPKLSEIKQGKKKELAF